MIIRGKEYGFLFSVGASVEMSKLCPDGDLNRLKEVFDAPFAAQAQTLAKMVEVLSAAHEQRRALDDQDYAPAPLTAEAVLSLSTQDFQTVVTEAFNAYKADMRTEIQLKPAKKNKAGGGK